ncbi:hypothetical protein [Streptomyces sp. NPDC031705]
MTRLQWPRIVACAADIVTSYDAVGGCTLRQARGGGPAVWSPDTGGA